MTPRERVLAAFDRDGAAEFAAVIPYEGIYFRDRWRDLSPRPWWHQFSADIEQQLGWRRDAARAIGQAWFAIGTSYSAEDRANISIEERPDGVYLLDRRGPSERRLEPPRVAGLPDSHETLSVRPADPPASQSDVERAIPLVDPARPERVAAEGRCELASRMLADFGAGLFPQSSVSSPLWQCYDIWGFEGLMMALVEQRELIRYACERHLANTLVGVRIAKAAGAMGIWIEECMLDMISPEDYRELVLPGLRAITDAIRAEGMKSIHYFCGNPARHWDCLLDSGADALSLEEGKKGFELGIEEVVERVSGRMTVLGNLDAIRVLQDGTDKELEREVRHQVSAGRANGSRFILSLGSPVTPGTPVSRVRRFCEMAEVACGEFDFMAGSWVSDPEVDSSLEDQRQIEPELWQ